MRHVLVYVGIAMVIGTAAIVYCMFFIWVPVALTQMGSRSEEKFLEGLEEQHIHVHERSQGGRWVEAITEVQVQWFYAGRAVALAEEIDPTGKKIVRAYPHYPDVKANSDWVPRDPEKP